MTHLFIFFLVVVSASAHAQTVENVALRVSKNVKCLAALDQAKHYPTNVPVIKNGKNTFVLIGADRDGKAGVYLLSSAGDVKWFWLDDPQFNYSLSTGDKKLNRTAELYFESTDGKPHHLYGKFSVSKEPVYGEGGRQTGKQANKYSMNDFEFSDFRPSDFKNPTTENGQSLKRAVEIPDQQALAQIDATVSELLKSVGDDPITNVDLNREEIRKIDEELSKRTSENGPNIGDRNLPRKTFDPSSLTRNELIAAKNSRLKSIADQNSSSSGLVNSHRNKFKKAAEACAESRPVRPGKFRRHFKTVPTNSYVFSVSTEDIGISTKFACRQAI